LKKIFWSLLLLSVAVPGFAQSRYTVFTQFASGAGWSSEVFLANQGLTPVSGIIASIYDEKGLPLSVSSNLGSGAVFTITLAAGATQAIIITPGSSTAVGYIVLRYPSASSPVTASEVFRLVQAGIVTTEVGVPQQSPDNNFSFPVEMNSASGIKTAVAFANATFDSTSAPAQTLIVSLINTDGTLRQTVKVPLGVGEHISLYLDQSPLFTGLDNFTGTLSVSSPFTVNVLALRQDKQAFGAISTDTGPILAPFAATGSLIPEVEPNNTLQAAQAIAANSIVQGFIGGPSDTDWYKFTGKAGDIVTVLCDTQRLTSILDSVVWIFKSDGTTVIANNDQNGLYARDDSFVQVVLPADGTYLIAITDYYGQGGANYTYNLHLRVTSSAAAPVSSSP
jgi:hypothetical protein